ncbi:MAG: uracil-DNA glycosylase [Anaerolineales bacterium]|nr:uracil-DNA glycosylase [Anaerolineales bacterium]MCB9126980.1 uracil-DNA glycosylase [Ardenticatenales bacterium]
MTTKESEMALLRAEALETLSPTLSADQHQVVFGGGDPAARLVLVGEAPGPQEDKQGIPFVGRSGQYLEQALQQLGLRRETLWISNVVKVWPTTRSGKSLRTRPPNAAERRASWEFFQREMALVDPVAILCLGGTAAKQLIGPSFKITQERGEWRTGPHQIPTLATYHPSYLLRMEGMRPEEAERMAAEFLSDLRRAAQRAGLVSEMR